MRQQAPGGRRSTRRLLAAAQEERNSGVLTRLGGYAASKALRAGSSFLTLVSSGGAWAFGDQKAEMEPEIFRRGKDFHRRVQDDWSGRIEGAQAHAEHGITLYAKPGSTHLRRGRLDIFLERIDDFVTVIELKSTDWDRVKASNRRKLLASHRRQVWRYVDKYVDVDHVNVCAGIIYPSPPTDASIRELVERYLNEWFLQVVWYDEPPASPALPAKASA